MTGRIEKTIFISYRRTNLPWALFIWQNLTMHGFDVFFDYQSIDSGGFENIILENIKARAHFIVVLTPSALERCKETGDWLRREIETAIDEKRNIIPLMMDGFDFGSSLTKEALTGKLSILGGINALPVPGAYAVEAMDRLRDRFLNKALSDVHLPVLQAEAEKGSIIQKTAATEAEPVKEEQLTAQTWFERGYTFALETKDREEAIRCFSEAIRLDFNLSAAFNNLGVLYSDTKRYEEAEAAYRKAIEINPAYASAYYNLGNLLSDEHFKRYEEAEAAYRKAIEINPAYASAYSNLGNLLSDEHFKRYEEAEAAYRKAIEINPAYASAYSNLGLLLHEKLKRYEEAEAAYRKAIEINPAEASAYSNLGNLLSDEHFKRYEEAEAAYRKAIEINPAYASAYSNLGLLLHEKLKRYEEAEAAYRKAIEINPAEASAYYNLGILLKTLERYEEAEAAYRKAIEINPAYASAYNNLAILLRQNNRDEDAIRILENLVELQPDNGAHRSSLMAVLRNTGKKSEAKKQEEIARKLIENDNEYNRACFEALCGNIEEALALLKIAFEKGESSKEWARQDPDFENIHDDPRFKELVDG